MFTFTLTEAQIKEQEKQARADKRAAAAAKRHAKFAGKTPKEKGRG
ncbi:hypothetical protein LCGC14_2663640 [marine sediment metagenome]|uniref:Uncharacterized protein n=1 Tax=marine sediment metagenome TaxID=412755 RepID=A0A0F8ZR81_9ZZZZ